MFISIHNMQYLKNKSMVNWPLQDLFHYLPYIIVSYILQNIMVTFHNNMIFVTNTFVANVGFISLYRRGL